MDADFNQQSYYLGQVEFIWMAVNVMDTDFSQ